jgi:hypothetical protein
MDFRTSPRYVMTHDSNGQYKNWILDPWPRDLFLSCQLIQMVADGQTDTLVYDADADALRFSLENGSALYRLCEREGNGYHTELLASSWQKPPMGVRSIHGRHG